MTRFTVRFEDEQFPPVEVRGGLSLSEELTVRNSPVLFGCRTGICGTCVVEVLQAEAELAAPDEDEGEILDLYADGAPTARLACQIDVTSGITLRARCKKRWSGA